MGTLNPETFESVEFRRVNDFLFSNPIFFRLRYFEFSMEGKMADYTIQSSRRHIDGCRWLIASFCCRIRQSLL